MARIRTIKPGFFKDEDLAELSMSTRLLFIGLWCLADKEGRLQDRPKRIKAELFPYDNIEIDQQLSRLQSAGFIIRYEVGEMKVVQIINFLKHQRITGTEATSESDLPEFSDACVKETTWKQQGNTLDDRNGMEGKGNGKERIVGYPEIFSGCDLENNIDLTKNKKKEKEHSPGPEISYPFGKDFLIMWQQWKEYKRLQYSFKYKGPQSEQAALNDLIRLSRGIESNALLIIEQSMAKGWKGFFELKTVNNGIAKDKQPTGASINTSNMVSRIMAMPDKAGNS